jgi:MFS family permease
VDTGLQIWNLIFAVTAALCVDKLGRRVLFLASAGTMLISYVVVTGLSGSFAQTGHAATGVAVVPFLFLYFAGYDIALTPLLVAYPCEIWPYALRSRGLTVTWVTAIVAIFFNTFVNPIALGAIGWKYYVVFVFVLLVMCATCYLCYPETRGHSLEQMAFIFDGEDAGAPAPAETRERGVSVSVEAAEGEKGEKGVVTTVLHEEKV